MTGEIGLVQRRSAGVDLDHGQAVIAFIDHRHQAVFHHRHAFRIVPTVERHFAQHIALQAQFDQEGVLAHHRKQGFGLGVVGQVRSLILLHTGQQLGVDHRVIVR